MPKRGSKQIAKTVQARGSRAARIPANPSNQQSSFPEITVTTESIWKVAERRAPNTNQRQLAPRERVGNHEAATTVSVLVERVQAEREQLFKAIAIVELCRLASASLLDLNDSECMTPVLETTCDLLNTSAERLELIASDLRSLSMVKGDVTWQYGGQ